MGMFGFLPHGLYVNHQNEDTTGMSPKLWGRLSSAITQRSPDGASRLILEGDSFTNVIAQNSSTEIVTGQQVYHGYIDTSNTFTGVTGVNGGAIELNTDATDNDEIWMSTGAATTGPTLGAISDAAGSAFMTAFEIRCKKSSVADNVTAMFAGLAEEGLAAADTKVDNTGVLADKDLIGFDNVHADGDAVNFVYRLAGQNLVTKISAVATLTADTFVKLGFIYDPFAQASERITVYVDNSPSTTFVTASDISTSTGDAFPDGENLAFLAGHKNGAATAGILTIDWWAYAQIAV